MHVNGTHQTSVREYHWVLALQLPSQNRFRLQIFRIQYLVRTDRFFIGFWHFWFKLSTHTYQAWQMLRLLRLVWHANHSICTMSNSAPLHGQIGNGIYLWLPWSMNLPKKITLLFPRNATWVDHVQLSFEQLGHAKWPRAVSLGETRGTMRCWGGGCRQRSGYVSHVHVYEFRPQKAHTDVANSAQRSFRPWHSPKLHK